jgi:uncharacterized protein (TIGR04255 family)
MVQRGRSLHSNAVATEPCRGQATCSASARLDWHDVDEARGGDLVPDRTDELPRFADPPVIEVLIAVQFASPAWSVLDVGEYRGRVRSRFPREQSMPPSPPSSMSERFAVPPESAIEFRIPTMPRVWLLTEPEDELIQVQEDRFAFNWRKSESVDREYPWFGYVRRQFIELLREFVNQVADGDIEKLRPDWCEVSYINHIEVAHRDVASVLRSVRAVELPAAGDREDLQLVERFVIRDASGVPTGRFILACVPAFRRSDGSPIVELTLTARSQVAGGGWRGIEAAVEDGHRRIVQTFADVTTDEMHTRWERVQ